VIGQFRWHGQVPTKDEINTHRIALSAIVIYQLSLLLLGTIQIVFTATTSMKAGH